MNALVTPTLLIFGVGTAISNSLMSAGVYLWTALAIYFLFSQVGKELVRDKPFLLGCAYCLYVLIVLFFKTSSSVFLGEVSAWLMFFCFVVAFATLRNKLSIKTHLNLDLLVGVSYVALWGLCLYQVFYLGIDRADGLHKNPNRLACALLPPIIYFGQRLLAGAYLRRSHVSFFVVLLAMLFHASLLTKTRSIFPFVIIYYSFIFFSYGMRLKLNFRSPRHLVLAGAALIGLVVVALLSNTASRFQFDSLLTQTSVVARFEIWKINWQTFLESPIWGVGFKQNLINAVDHPSLYPYVELNVRGWFAHNIFLQVLTESGVVGFLMFFGFLLWAALRKPYVRWYVLAIFIAGLTETILYIPRSMPAMVFFVVLSGFAARATRTQEA